MAQCIYRLLLPVGDFLAFSRPVVRIRPSGVEVLRHPNRFGSEISIGKLGDRLIVPGSLCRRYQLFGDKGQEKSTEFPTPSPVYNLALCLFFHSSW